MKSIMHYLIITAVLVLFSACGGGGGGGGDDGRVENLGTEPLAPFYGSYNVTFTGRVGGAYQPTDSIVSGTTTGVVDFVTTGGTVTLSASEPGVIAVPSGETVPGVEPEAIIYGAALMQNPIYVFMGTPEASQIGDFGLYSMLKIGLPSGSNQLFYTGNKGSPPFSFVPMFYRRTTMSGDSVNLVYFTSQVSGDNTTIRINGQLFDKHTTEAATANLFSVPIESPILGSFNDPFMFEKGTLFEITVSGNNISGLIRGTGNSVAGLVPQTAIFEVTFEGVKE